MLHLNLDGTLIHEAPSNGTLHALDFIDGFKDEATQNVLPLKQMFEKSVSGYVEKNQIETTDAFEDFSIACPGFENVRHRLANLRCKETPLLLKTLITIDLNGKYFLTSYNQPFSHDLITVAQGPRTQPGN